jgi:hypothetical protein
MNQERRDEAVKLLHEWHRCEILAQFWEDREDTDPSIQKTIRREADYLLEEILQLMGA